MSKTIGASKLGSKNIVEPKMNGAKRTSSLINQILNKSSYKPVKNISVFGHNPKNKKWLINCLNMGDSHIKWIFSSIPSAIMDWSWIYHQIWSIMHLFVTVPGREVEIGSSLIWAWSLALWIFRGRLCNPRLYSPLSLIRMIGSSLISGLIFSFIGISFFIVVFSYFSGHFYLLASWNEWESYLRTFLTVFYFHLNFYYCWLSPSIETKVY